MVPKEGVILILCQVEMIGENRFPDRDFRN